MAWLIASLIAGMVGPFGTFESMTIGKRLAYWTCLVGVAIALGLGIRHVIVRVMGRSDTVSDMVGPVIMAPVFGTLVTLFNGLVTERVPFTWATLWWNVGVVALVCWGVVLVRVYMRHASVEAGADVPTPGRSTASPRGDVVEVPPFLQDAPADIRESYAWIEADDHYLRVHAPGGRSERVLMRFRDALEHLRDVPGVRVHRSHWVRMDAITEVRPDGKRHVVVLPCGSEVPVSKTYLPDLLASGVMEDITTGGVASVPIPVDDPEGSRVPRRP